MIFEEMTETDKVLLIARRIYGPKNVLKEVDEFYQATVCTAPDDMPAEDIQAKDIDLFNPYRCSTDSQTVQVFFKENVLFHKQYIACSKDTIYNGNPEDVYIDERTSEFSVHDLKRIIADTAVKIILGEKNALQSG